MITPSDVLMTQARAAAASTMTLSADLVRSELSDDGYGGQVPTETPVATVPCRVKSIGGRELFQLEKIAPSATHSVTVPFGTEVAAATDAFIIESQRYEVLFVPVAPLGVEVRCLCGTGDN